MNAHPDPTHVDVSSAHASSLEQLSNDEFWRLAVSTALATPAPLAPSNDYLECVLVHGHCLLPLAVLREIASPPYTFSRFPATPSWMTGIGAWRGETIAIVDLDAYLFHHAARSPQHVTDAILVVAQIDDLTLGFLVKDVGTVTALDVEQVVPFEQASTWYTHLQTEVVLGVTCDGGGNRQLNSEALLLDMSVLVHDIVQHLKSDRLL
jgi:chemotaxis signal transduction protein